MSWSAPRTLEVSASFAALRVVLARVLAASAVVSPPGLVLEMFAGRVPCCETGGARAAQVLGRYLDAPDRAIELAIRWPDARRWGMEVRPILSPDGVEM